MSRVKPVKIGGIALLVIVGVFVFGLIIQLLWNWLIPTLFSGPQITYWQALGLFLLSKLFFGHSVGNHNHHRDYRKHEFPWKNHLREELQDQTGETRTESQN